MVKIKCILDWLKPFHQKRKQVISFPRTLFCSCLFTTDFIFSTNLWKYQNVLKCIPLNIESWSKRQFKFLNYGRTLNYTMNDCMLTLATRIWKMRYENRCYSINLTYFLFTVDMLFSLIFFLVTFVCLCICNNNFIVWLYTRTRQIHGFHCVSMI